MELAALLYLATAGLLLTVWSRCVRSISRAAAAALVLIPVVFTGRALLTNRVYAPVDLAYLSEPLADYARDVHADKIRTGELTDVVAQLIPWRAATRWAIAHGEWPLWNPFQLCGDVLAAAAQPAVYDPVNAVSLLIPLPDAVTYSAVATFFLAAFFTFCFARETGLGETASLVAAAAFALSGGIAFAVAWPLARAWAMLPFVLVAVKRRSAALLLTALVMLILAGHPETILHVVAIGCVYALFEWRKRVLPAIAAGVLALLLTAIYLLPFLEAAPQTVEYRVRRDVYAATKWYPVVPAQIANQAKRFGREAGAVTIALAIAALFLRPSRDTRIFLGFFLVCACAAFEAPPVTQILHVLPLFDTALNDRLTYAAMLFLCVIAASAIEGRFAPLVLAAVLVERTILAGGIYPAMDRNAFYPVTPVIAAIRDGGRVVGQGNAFTPDTAALYRLEDARGYEAMTLQRLAGTYPLWSVAQPVWFNRVDDLSKPFLSFLNVRYAITTRNAAIPPGWRLVRDDRNSRLIENRLALPRVFIPQHVHYAPRDEVPRMADFTQRAEIYAPQYPEHDIDNGPGVLTVRRDGTRYTVAAAMQRDGWIVLSESAWRGWRTYVDERRVEWRYANHAFVGVFVPAGKHRVRFVYLPESFTRGRTISAITAAALIAFVTMRRRASRGTPARDHRSG